MPNKSRNEWFLATILALGFLLTYRSPVFADCLALSEGFRIHETQWLLDNIDTTTELKTFWQLHPRFGFVRQNDRIYLVARDQALANSILSELRPNTTTEPLPQNTSHLDIPGFQFDVTAWIPTLVRFLHAKPLRADGPNCWNFCLNSLVTAGTLPMSAEEFSHWLNSPLAKEVSFDSQVKRGDILVFRQKNAHNELQEVHGAVYWSPHLAIAKSAAGRHFPHRILDLQEAVGFYFPKRSSQVQIYRLQPITSAAQNLTSPSGQELRKLIDAALDLEKTSLEIFLGVKLDGSRVAEEQRVELENAFEDMALRITREANTVLDHSQRRSTLSPLELALWQGLRYKAHTYRQITLFD